jgi:hypothetical protein
MVEQNDVIDGSEYDYNSQQQNHEKEKNKKKKLTVYTDSVDQIDPELIPNDNTPKVSVDEYINRKGKRHDYTLAYMKATFKGHPKDTVKSWEDKYKNLGGK